VPRPAPSPQAFRRPPSCFVPVRHPSSVHRPPPSPPARHWAPPSYPFARPRRSHSVGPSCCASDSHGRLRTRLHARLRRRPRHCARCIAALLVSQFECVRRRYFAPKWTRRRAAQRIQGLGFCRKEVMIGHLIFAQCEVACAPCPSIMEFGAVSPQGVHATLRLAPLGLGQFGAAAAWLK
jgi:hypothetical protein